ncbi:uncharacterized protein PGTG_07204 [Puccinia graminis f. sp. tritici CRL 75-36-700-3]|uniref:NADPH-dependent diflavin oxidoreductase 1 n=1 Tax=Puccinia graminis f. sp. tritici (strain CRL 75-36-700-3 / race SCCL) TaxID=418459 RepID=E3K9U8_PUCGT|nr:uncharacterized protein PGTG_07204 [Puccinia graminis f. sp. tritici CRL 75-36-700-3]EFP80952.1 hypothetical protein PGTG_07204 [Puccinia graminis f. sp. tritici CRL 75-36-700-3]
MEQGPSSDDRRRLLILYASQTGTAEDVAQQIARGARRLHFKTETTSMDDYERDKIFDEDLVIFVCSTTGQGVQPQNMNKFWNALKLASLPNDFIDNIRFALFGLGDSSYPKFNWAAKKLFRRLTQIGAQVFYERGEADDQNPNGIDSTLLPWLEGLWKKLIEIKPLPEHLTPIPPATCLPPSFRLEPTTTTPTPLLETIPKSNQSIPAILTKNQRITAPDHWQDTRHLEFEFDQTLEFQPGSVAEILPENCAEDVEKLFKLMKWTDLSDQVYKLSYYDSNQQDLPAGWTEYATLREIFTSRLDFMAVPGRSFIDWLSHFTSDPMETERLQEFCSIEGQDDLFEYTKRPRRTILEVLSEFKSATIPLDYIHDVFPQIRPRQFSIASSPKLFPNQIQLLVAVVNYKTRLSVPRKGLCTSYLSKLEIGTRIHIGISGGYVTFPQDPSQPVICIGPGTGIAPFRALIQDRSTHHISDVSSRPNALVFFGCRAQDSDFYYREQWTQFVDLQICNFFWAASRDQENKRYVQDLIVENSALVWEYMAVRNASIFISGSAGEMPKGVRSALKKVCVGQGGLDQTGADEFIERLEALGKLQEDTWS